MVIFQNYFKIFILLLGGWGYFSHAVSVRVDISSKIVGVNQPFNLTVSISSEEDVDISTPVLPKDISPFAVQGSSQSTSISHSFSMPGGQTKTIEKRFIYTLSSGKEGQWTIRSISVKVDGKIYKTKEIKVEVSKQAPSPPSGSLFNHPLLPKIFQDESESFPFSFPRNKPLSEDEFLLKPDKDRRTVYLGQSLPVRWFLYKKNRHSFDVNIQAHENIQPEHFWTEKIKDPSSAQFTKTETINDQEYFRSLAASYIFFPLKKGILKYLL